MFDLNDIRKKIDEIDRQVVELYEKRMSLSIAVADYKIGVGKKVLDVAREKEKLEAISKLVKEEKNEHDINELFTQIMSMSRKVQYRMLEQSGITLKEPCEMADNIDKANCKVVYQGVPGAYSYIAMKNYFGAEVHHIQANTWREAMEIVKSGEADYAVLPIENSTTGIVAPVYDLLQEYNNYMIAETYVKVEHALLGLPETEFEQIETVYSHPQGFLQCAKYLEKYNTWQQIGQPNTAGSAKKVLEDNDPTHVAIASKEAAEYYGLKVLGEKINDEDSNTTRFVIISNKRRFLKSAKKISICFETNDETGTLYNTLSHIIYNGLNMKKIESRPIEGKAWKFRFFVDFMGNVEDLEVKNALRGIEEEAEAIKFLGNY